MSSSLPLLVEVPICAFRPYASREYQDTFSVPTPATVYGMLLSLLGIPREQKDRHRGAEMALAVEQLPPRSKVFRKLRRGADLENTRPDYQDLLMELRLWIWLRSGADQGTPTLAVEVRRALSEPGTITRCGGLSLGESSYLVNSITFRESPPEMLRFIQRHSRGFHSLPIWVDHLNRKNTVLDRFEVSQPISVGDGLANSWLRIGELLPEST